VRIVRQSRVDDPAYAIGKKLFEEKVLPQITGPEGFQIEGLAAIENLKTCVFFRNNVWFRISRKMPSVLSHVEGKEAYFFFLDDLLAEHLGPAFRLEGDAGFLQITRDGDFEVDVPEEDIDQLPEMIRKGLLNRELGRPVRLQYNGHLPEGILGRVIKHFKLNASQVFPAPTTLYLRGLWTVFNQLPESFDVGSNLRYPKTIPHFSSRVKPEGLFEEIQKKDLLFHYPYDSFDSYVAFLQNACEDPQVTSIQQTIYRVDRDSKILGLLKQAASKKRVRVLVELRARFDELNNLNLAEELEAAGAEVSFGFPHLKLHAKMAVVTREEGGQVRHYTHLSTGNYNAVTAAHYEDLAILTADPELGQDAIDFFDAVAAERVPDSFRKLVAAPTDLHKKLVSLIQAEAAAAKKGQPARIVAKVNALVDENIVRQLYKASQAGVQIDLIVRGPCSLIPGVPGMSERIRVISVVDRFLEHSRIYYFAASKALYLSSADWMPRNFFSRLELAFPVLEPSLYAYITEVVIPAYLSDSSRARELTPQGLWKKRTLTAVRSHIRLKEFPVLGIKPLRSQFFFQDLAAKGYEGTSLG
jgi:polyphosphate kinase